MTLFRPTADQMLILNTLNFIHNKGRETDSIHIKNILDRVTKCIKHGIQIMSFTDFDAYLHKATCREAS